MKRPPFPSSHSSPQQRGRAAAPVPSRPPGPQRPPTRRWAAHDRGEGWRAGPGRDPRPGRAGSREGGAGTADPPAERNGTKREGSSAPLRPAHGNQAAHGGGASRAGPGRARPTSLPLRRKGRAGPGEDPAEGRTPHLYSWAWRRGLRRGEGAAGGVAGGSRQAAAAPSSHGGGRGCGFRLVRSGRWRPQRPLALRRASERLTGFCAGASAPTRQNPPAAPGSASGGREVGNN